MQTQEVELGTPRNRPKIKDRGPLWHVTVSKLNGQAVSPTLVTTYGYDNVGNKTSETQSGGSLSSALVTTYTYDGLNRLTDVLEQRGATTLFSQHYILNDDGTRASVDETQLQPDSTTITSHTAWAYDALSRLAGEVLTTSATNQSYSDAFAFDLASNRASLVHEVKLAGFTANYTASTLTFGEPKASVVVGTKLRLSVSGGNLPAGLSAGVDYYVVQPDSSGRTFKVALTRGGQPVGFTDNGSGSLQVTAQDAAGWVALLTRYTYNGNDQLTAEGADANGDGIPDTTTAISYTYDANGSQLTSTPYGQATTTYTYDVRNKMVGYSGPSGSATYVYDDEGNRVQETTGGATTYYVTDTENPTGYAQPIEAKPSPTGTPSMTYLIGDRVFGQANGSGVVSYFLVDGHGSTRALADATGAITKTLNYNAFGSALNFTPSTAGTVFLFGGDAVYDPVSGTYFHGNGVRQRLGFRFIEMDTYAGEGNDPLSLHKYVYCETDPVNGWDPSGRSLLVGELLGNYGEAWLWAGLAAGAATLGTLALQQAGAIRGMMNAVSRLQLMLCEGISSLASSANRLFDAVFSGAAMLTNALDSGIEAGRTAVVTWFATRLTGSIGAIADAYNTTADKVRKAIHRIKKNLKSGAKEKNPDVVVDTDTGEVYPVGEDGTVGEDPIGNMNDELEGEGEGE